MSESQVMDEDGEHITAHTHTHEHTASGTCFETVTVNRDVQHSRQICYIFTQVSGAEFQSSTTVYRHAHTHTYTHGRTRINTYIAQFAKCRLHRQSLNGYFIDNSFPRIIIL